MLRFLPFIWVLAFISFGANAIGTTVSLSQLDAALERATTQIEPTDPTLETLQNSYRETRGLLLDIKRQDDKLEAYSAARANAYQQAQEITSELEAMQEKPAIAFNKSSDEKLLFRFNIKKIDENIFFHKSLIYKKKIQKRLFLKNSKFLLKFY